MADKEDPGRMQEDREAHPHYKEDHRCVPLEESAGTFAVRTVALLVVQILIVILFGIVFTEIGKGATIFRFLAKFHILYEETVLVLGILIFLLFMFDFRFWSPGVAQIIVACFVGAGVVFASIFAFRGKPYAPLAIMYVTTPLVYMFFFVFIFKKAHLSNYMKSMGIVLGLAGLSCLVVGGVWNGKNDFWWGEDSNAEFRARLRVCDLVEKPICGSAAPLANCSLYNVLPTVDEHTVDPITYATATATAATAATAATCDGASWEGTEAECIGFTLPVGVYVAPITPCYDVCDEVDLTRATAQDDCENAYSVEEEESRKCTYSENSTALEEDVSSKNICRYQFQTNCKSATEDVSGECLGLPGQVQASANADELEAVCQAITDEARCDSEPSCDFIPGRSGEPASCDKTWGTAGQVGGCGFALTEENCLRTSTCRWAKEKPNITNIFCLSYGVDGEACYCPPELEIPIESACADPYEPNCLAPFMLWAGPFMAAVIMLVCPRRPGAVKCP